MWPPGRREYTCRWATHIYVCIEKLTSGCPDDYLKVSVIHLMSQLDKSVPLTVREYLWTMPPPSTPSGLFYRPITWFANTTVGKPPLDRSQQCRSIIPS